MEYKIEELKQELAGAEKVAELQRARAKDAEREVQHLKQDLNKMVAEIEMLRGVGCTEDGDGPCGCCIKCYKSEIDRLKKAKKLLEESYGLLNGSLGLLAAGPRFSDFEDDVVELLNKIKEEIK